MGEIDQERGLIVRTSSGITSARLAWREGERGRMRPTLLVGSREVSLDRVEVVSAAEAEAEVLELAGIRTNVAR